jgi:hypothetical protein
MGYRSHVNYQYIKIVDVEGLKQWLHEKDYLEKQHSYDYIKEACIKHLNPMELTKEGEYEDFFSFMDDWKIVSYWYKDCCQFFKEIALYIDGSVSFWGEDNAQCATITFEDGECNISCGEMKYDDFSPDTVSGDILTPISPERIEAAKKKRLLNAM